MSVESPQQEQKANIIDMSNDEGSRTDELDAHSSKSEEDSTQSCEIDEELQTTRTRSATYRKKLRRVKKIKEPRIKVKMPDKIMVEETKTASAKHNDKMEIIVEPDIKSDIEEDECIPNGCKSIECFICSCRLSKIYNLRIHMETHKEEESFDMETFEKSEIFNVLNPHKRNIDSNIIRNFVIQEIKAKRYSQFYCILNEAAVELHISDSETDSDDAGDIIPHNNYRCELCKKNFDRRYKALFHQKTGHVKTDYVVECDYCLKKFVCMNLLIHHLKTQCESDEKPVPCTERFMKYLLKANLDYYASLAQAREQRKLRKLTEAPKTYTCNTCNKSFTRQEHLNRHSAVHLPDEMKFECPVCDRRFNRKDNMRSHMKTHTEEGARNAESRKILCSYCGRSFSSKSNYVVHMRRHTGEKPYKCDVCGKGFPKSTDLNSHKITHTGEKNFVCTICNKAFARSAVLSKHMRVHNDPYPCTFCLKTFTKPSALIVHLRTHTGGRSCVCVVCNESFETKNELDGHFATTGHNNEPKRVIVIKETVALVKKTKGNEEDRLAPPPPVSKIKTNDDPLEIKEEEWRTTKVKVPVNEAIQSVLQRSTNPAPAEVVENLNTELQQIEAQENESVMSAYSPLDARYDDDMQYGDWEVNEGK